MLRIYISEIGDIPSAKDKEILDNLNESLQKRALSAKNDKAKREKIFTYALLTEALLHSGYAGDIILAEEKHGKPQLDGGVYKISLSHTDKLCAVAISDEGEVGIDAEEISGEEKTKAAVKRFLNDFSPSLNFSQGVKIYDFDFIKSSFTKCKIDPIREAGPSSFTVLWTAAEALLKCDGGGFASLPSLEKIESESLIYSFTVREKYSVSLAIKRK